MEILDKDSKNVFRSFFQYPARVLSFCFHALFLETCKSYGFCSTGFNIRKKTFTDFEGNKVRVFEKETITNLTIDLLPVLCVEICQRMFNIDKKGFGCTISICKR